MANIRADKEIHVFFDSVNTPLSAAAVSPSIGTNGFQVLTLEVTGADASLTVQGCLNVIGRDGLLKPDAECEWTNLAIINLSDYSVIEEITEKGVYAIGIGDTARYRVNVTSVSGSATIIGFAGV